VVPYARTADGVNVAVKPLYVTTPAMAVPPGPVTVKVPVLIVVGLIAVLKVAVMFVLIRTPVSPAVGLTDTTPGMVTVS
jgi:hypothetical protein